MNFSKQIRAFTDKANKNASLVFRLSALNLFSDVIMTSIVGEPGLWKSKPPKGYTGGRYRMNWQASINSPAVGELDATDKTGSKAIAGATGVTSNARIGQRIYLVNNLPYAQGIEDGTASMRGTGKVKLAALKWNRIVKAVTKKVNP